MQGPDYKEKYKALRTKYIGDLDVAFRLGFEAGAQQAQQQQAQDAQQQANEQEMQMDQHGHGAEGLGSAEPDQDASASGPNPESGGIPDAQSEQRGSELDQHIGKLEGMIGNSSPDVQKSLQAIVSLRKAEKDANEMKKSQSAISGISKALHKPSFKLGVQASHNMNDNAKKAVSLQHKIVNDVMKSWNSEEEKAKNSIESILNIEGLLKD